MEQTTSCIVHHLNGFFVIFDTKHALQLRRSRILCQPVGGGILNPHFGPYHLSLYAIHVVVREKLAVFIGLEPKDHVSVEQNKAGLDEMIVDTIDREAELFRAQRLEELQKRNIPVTPKTMKQFDESKLRITLMNTPSEKYSSYSERPLNPKELNGLLKTSCDINKLSIFNDMYRRGFYVSSGMKFGGDFLAYAGDPVRYHAQFVVRLVQSTPEGYVDLSKTDYNIVNGFQRLTHTANKIPLSATVVLNNDLEEHCSFSPENYKVRYWTLKDREYLTPDSRNTDFESVDPNPRNTNKVRRFA